MKVSRYFLCFAAILFVLVGFSVFNSKAGMLLIEASAADDQHSRVVYISRHSLFGAQGVILNKLLLLSELQKTRPELIQTGQKIFYGGSHAYPQSLFLLHIVTNMEGVEDVILTPIPVDHHILTMKDGELGLRGEHRILLGYQSWRPFALDYKILSGQWRVSEFDLNRF